MKAVQRGQPLNPRLTICPYHPVLSPKPSLPARTGTANQKPSLTMVVAIAAHKIAYMPVPKAACSSVKAALGAIDPETSLSVPDLKTDVSSVHTTFKTRRFRQHRWRMYEGWWRFAVVRDPLSRLLSVYSDLVLGRQELHQSPNLRDQSILPVDPDPDFFFQHLDRYIQQASSVKHHTLRYRIFLGPTPFAFDRIYKVGELPELAQRLSDISGQKVEIPRLNSSVEKLKVDDLRPETLGFIREYLRDDYKKLADFYTSPL